MKRKLVDETTAEAKRLLDKIETLKRCAGWTRYVDFVNVATTKPHPDDSFNYGEHTAAVKRASMDLTKALARLRKG